jgi:hypothetical protein
MSRQVITKAFTIPAIGYGQPARVIPAGAVVELSAAEISAITTAGGTVRVTTARDALGESAGASNSS